VTASRDPNNARTSSGTAIGSMRISRAPSSIAYADTGPSHSGCVAVQWNTPSGSNWSDVRDYRLLAPGNRSLTKAGLHTLMAWPDSARPDGEERPFAAELMHSHRTRVPGAEPPILIWRSLGVAKTLGCASFWE
jgi:hypothetical protein